MIALALFSLILLIISINDFLFFRIEDEYVLMLLFLCVLLFGFSSVEINFVQGLQAAFAAFIIGFLLNRYNLLGGGDVKLLFPVLILSGSEWLSFFFWTSIWGFVLACSYALFNRQIFFLRRRLILFLHSLRRKHKAPRILNFILLSFARVGKKSTALRRYRNDILKLEIPYGLAITGGGFAVIYGLIR